MRQKLFHPLKGIPFALIPLVVYVFFILIPVFGTITASFRTESGWGIGHFIRLAGDEVFIDAFKHNIILMVILVIAPLLIGLLLATLLERGNARGRKLFETAYFIPQILSLVVVGLIWKWIYNPSFGLLTSLLKAANLFDWNRSWLGDPKTALASVAVAGIWVYYGFALVILLAGYKTIPASLYESAQIDGAGSIRQFFAVSLPHLMRPIGVVITFLFITSLKTFDLVYIMTKGQPARATDVMALVVFKNAFQYNHYDYAAAMAFVLAIFIYLGAFLLSRFTVEGGSRNER